MKWDTQKNETKCADRCLAKTRQIQEKVNGGGIYKQNHAMPSPAPTIPPHIPETPAERILNDSRKRCREEKKFADRPTDARYLM
jgi:hypothetical protein